MKRTQIYLSEQQHEVLRRMAYEQRKSISQVIRDLIDQLCNKSADSVAKTVKRKAPEKARISEEKSSAEKQDQARNRIDKVLASDQVADATEITESLKDLVSEEKYNQLTTALEEYRKSLEKLKKRSPE